MKVIELKRQLSFHDRHDSDEVCIKVSRPSIGAQATSRVKSASFGFDWDSGYFILYPELRLSEKTKPEEVYDGARDLLMYLATKPSKRKSYETETAQRILKKAGYTEEDFEKYRSFWHKDR